MSERMYSLLDDPLIRVRTTDDRVREMSLPDIYEALWAEQILGFEALQAHQRQPWFSFLVQVAAMATARAGRDEPPSDAATWRELLVDLADGSEDAWHLVVEDVERPAFMQPPIPEGSVEDAGFSAYQTPDELDVLIASKLHDMKPRHLIRPSIGHWLYALIGVQTTGGYSKAGPGARRYAHVVRMNGSYASRPFVGLTPSLNWGSRVRRDTSVLLNKWADISRRYNLEPDGIALMWLLPWDGKQDSTIPLSSCAPFFIEICRRIRFTHNSDGTVNCWRVYSEAPRVQVPNSFSGDAGDPWIPVRKKDDAALNVKSDAFNYEQLQEVWLGTDFESPPALKFQRDDPEQAYLVATALARGQGKTEGYHRRIVPVPQEVSRVMGRAQHSDQRKLAERAETRVKLAAKVRSQVLRAPVFTLVYDGRQPTDPNWDKVNKWLDGYDRAVDDRFFDALWDSVVDGLSDPQAKAQWHRILRRVVEHAYHDIRDSIPIRSIHRYRILSDADSQFYGRLRSVLDRAFDDDDHSNQEETNERPATA